MAKAESFECTINSTSGQVSSVRVSSYKTVELGAYGSDKDHTLPKEKLQSLIERLCGLLRLSGVVCIIKQSLSCQEGPRTVPV